jgi:septum formation protein
MITGLERPIYLASRSPRRRELLTQIDVKFHLLLFRADPRADADTSEDLLPGEAPDVYVLRIARAKAEAGWKRVVMRNIPRAPVLAADTAVAVDERILVKPANRLDGATMLASLSGRRHEVLTAVALKYEDHLDSALSRSEVEFRPISDDEIKHYLATGEGDDKAGGYAVQGRAAQFVTALRGSYSGVMGMPLYETAQLIEKLGTFRDKRYPR